MKNLELNARYPKLVDAVWRGWNEVHSATNGRRLLLEIYESGYAKISTRKGVIFSALEESIKLRMCRLLDRDARAESAGFEYLKRCCPIELEEICRREGVKLSDIESVASRLTQKRDQSFVHIDKKALGRAQEIWREDPISWNEFDAALQGLFRVYRRFFEILNNEPAPFFDLKGELPRAVNPKES